MTDNCDRLHANCSLLARKDQHLAEALLQAVPDPAIGAVPSRSGHLVPVVRGARGSMHLHSRYDPLVEAERRASAWEGGGCIVAVGLGGGFHVEAMLTSPGVGTVVIVEKSLEVLRALFGLLRLEAVIADPRTTFVVGVNDLGRRVAQAWHPLLTGSLRTVTLPTWCALERSFCESAAEEIRAAVESVRADYSVQAHFGKRWFLNMLRNLQRAETSDGLGGLEAARVSAAGPSLDLQLSRLAQAGHEGPLLATDTSLAALQRAGIVPDAVVSIDCQHYTYHHFLQGIPEKTVLYLDLASPPLLARRHQAARFVCGNHPLARYLAAHWRPFPVIDTSGGNVTHAAVSLAVAMGARRVTIYGADYSYPAGKPYARGTYLYDIFDGASDRVRPLQSRVHSFVLRTPDVRRERIGEHLRYSTALLGFYRDRLLELMQEGTAVMEAVPGEGLPLRLDEAPVRATPSTAGTRLNSTPSRCGWQEFLRSYAASLSSLPVVSDPPWRSFEGLDASQRELWSTLLPVAACIARENADSAGPAATLEAARAWAARKAGELAEPGRLPTENPGSQPGSE